MPILFIRNILLFHRKVLFKLFFTTGILLVILTGCTVKNPVVNKRIVPVLSNLTLPDTLYLKTSIKYPISVKVSDPQGVEDISIVKAFLSLQNNMLVVWEDTLKDDGKGCDIIPHDGLFSGFLQTDSTLNSGIYKLGIVAEDFSHHLSDTLFAFVPAVKKKMDTAPSIQNPIVPDTLKTGFMGNVFLSVQARDPQGLGDLDSVWVEVYPPLSPVPYFTGLLFDDGTGGDLEASDSIFSARINLEDKLKDPPVLSNLAAPDTISRSAGKTIVLSVHVTDPQGLSDIKSVYFNVTKPDGTPADGNPFFMYDDGDETNHGDKTAGDGIYSLIIIITPQNAKGNYRFDFMAEDYSWGIGTCYFRFQAVDKEGLKSDPVVKKAVGILGSAVSNTLSHTITVVD